MASNGNMFAARMIFADKAKAEEKVEKPIVKFVAKLVAQRVEQPAVAKPVEQPAVAKRHQPEFKEKKEYFEPIIASDERADINAAAIDAAYEAATSEAVLEGKKKGEDGEKIRADSLPTKAAFFASLACIKAIASMIRRLERLCESLTLKVAAASKGKDYEVLEKELVAANYKRVALQALTVSFEKQATDRNTSVTTGVACSLDLKIGEVVGIVNGGTGSTRLQYYEMTEDGLKLLYEDKDYKGVTPSFSQLSIIGSGYKPKEPLVTEQGDATISSTFRRLFGAQLTAVQEKASASGSKLSPALKNLRVVRHYVVITGTLREYFITADEGKQRLISTFLDRLLLERTEQFCGVALKPWTRDCWFISQDEEGLKEAVAVNGVVKFLGREVGMFCEAAICLGIGRGSSQWVVTVMDEDRKTRQVVIGAKYGMSDYKQLSGLAAFITAQMEENNEAILNGLIRYLASLNKQGFVPVLGLKSGCLLMPPSVKALVVPYKMEAKGKGK